MSDHLEAPKIKKEPAHDHFDMTHFSKGKVEHI